ncbi:Saccharopine dehydrogenase-domain-containing protein [Flagelloscypha sp. PMI_526]|nr:Saccharopine dehydrogenase-domain-containing protein [Flagelloscypha sp. PMI_526]
MSIDILVLGATGLTGKLISRYLATHTAKPTFTIGLAGRSTTKLDALFGDLSILGDEKGVFRVVVDLLDDRQVDAALSKAKVVINAASPYHFTGDSVVKACIKYKVQYVDLAGELVWTRSAIQRFDAQARTAGVALVNLCGFDCIPSDSAVYLANQTIKQHSPRAPLGIASSVGCYSGTGGLSRGTMESIYTMFDHTPIRKIVEGMGDTSLSPIPGRMWPIPRPIYSLRDPQTGNILVGGMFPLAPLSRALLRRTWGLLELENARSEERISSYGPEFRYDEFVQTPNRLIGLFLTLIVVSFMFCAAIWPIRPLLRWMFSQGIGARLDEISVMEKRSFSLFNVTTSTTSKEYPEPIVVQTVIRGQGDAAYLLTSIMISESALCFLGSREALPSMTKKGGFLTPMTAFGDILIERLKKTGRFEFKSERVRHPCEGGGARKVGYRALWMLALAVSVGAGYFF